MKKQLTELEQAQLQMAKSQIKILGKIVESGKATENQIKRLQRHVKLYIEFTGDLPD